MDQIKVGLKVGAHQNRFISEVTCTIKLIAIIPNQPNRPEQSLGFDDMDSSKVHDRVWEEKQGILASSEHIHFLDEQALRLHAEDRKTADRHDWVGLVDSRGSEISLFLCKGD